MRKIIAIKILKEKNTYYLFDSEGNKSQSNQPQDIFNFLLKDSQHNNIFKIVWNIYTLVDLIGHIIPTKSYETLINKDRVEITYDEHTYRLFSSQGRMFAITHKWSESTHANFQNKYQEEVNFYHISQFFPNEHYESLEDIKSKGEELLKALDEMDFNPTKLSSAVAIYDEKLKNQYVPRMLDLEDDGLDFCDYARNLMTREWRCCYRIGHWEHAFDYDVNSGYPGLIANFKDTNEAIFFQSKSFPKLSQFDFGVVKGTINITSDYSPIVNRDGKNVKGRYNDYFTTEQIGYTYFYKQGTFEMEDGRFIKFLGDSTPFKQIMEELYSFRELGGIKKNFVKAISVGIGGKFGQEYDDKLGEYYNPIYSIMMTSKMPLKVGKFIMNNHLEPHLISVVVDGCLTDKLVPLENTKRMGDWRVEEVKTLTMSLGYQFTGDKRPGNITYNEMMDEIKEHPNKAVYKGILLNPNMLSNNHIFNKFPKTGNDILKNIYESTALAVKE